MADATSTSTLLARGLGRIGFRQGRALHLVVADAEQRHPGIDRAEVRSGWYAERAEGIEDVTAIGGGR